MDSFLRRNDGLFTEQGHFMWKMMTIWAIGLLLLGCEIEFETSAAVTATAAYEATSRMLWVEDEGRITEEAPTQTPLPPTTTPLPPTPTPTVVITPPPVEPPATLPLYGNGLPFDFVVEIYTYTATTGDVQHTQTVQLEHNNLQPATRYTVVDFDGSVLEVTLTDDIVDTVGGYGICQTVSADGFYPDHLFNYHWLRTFGALEFFQPAEPFAGTSNDLPTERYTFASRALVDADDQLDGIVGIIETHHFNEEQYITMHAQIDALATGNPVMGDVGETTINYRYDVTVLDEGFGIDRPIGCIQPNVTATETP